MAEAAEMTEAGTGPSAEPRTKRGQRARGQQPFFQESLRGAPRKQVLLPSGLGKLCVPHWDYAPHVRHMEEQLLKLAKGEFRRLMLCIPIRHGKSEMANLFIAWLLISKPTLRIMRVMASADTAQEKARDVLKYVERWGPRLTGVKLDKRRCSAQHFKTEAGGELRSWGIGGDPESWTFDVIVADDVLVDPYELRNANRRDQVFKDLNTKFFSRVTPTGNTKFLFIGSRRHPDDCQGRFLEQDASLRRQQKLDPRDGWVYHQKPAIFHEGQVDAEGKSLESALWPESPQFNLEKLRAIRNEKIEQGVAWEWSSSFQNDPLACPDMLAFDPSWFDPAEMFYDCPQAALPAAKHTLIAFDPSMGNGSDLNDYFAALYLRFTADGAIYVDDSYIAQAGPDVAVEMSVNLIARHPDVSIIPFEANAGGRYIAKCIADKCAEKGIACPLVFKNWTSGDHKLDMGDVQGRITLALWEKLSRKKVKLRDTPWNRILYKQLRGFPTEKLDGPDALATGDIVLRQLLSKGRV